MTCFSVCFKQKASSPAKQNVGFKKACACNRASNGNSERNTENLSEENVKLYSYKELQLATENFNPRNKIGEGGFGSVYKGRLKDGSLAAIKVLSVESKQGVREFLTEIITISGMEHENLVKLYGCCAERDHRILVYGYVENNSLSQTLLGDGYSNIQFSWRTRTKICIGVARGLAFLHEEVRPHIIHRDIKPSNILLGKDLTAKISDFGLAKLFPDNLTHISTRVAGTIGYLAPEYAMQGQLTRKADVYGFGVLLLEIVSGRCNTNKRLPVEERYLLETAWKLYEKRELIQLVDMTLEGDFDMDEACRYLKIGLLCTQDMPKSRPAMSTVLKLLTGEMDLRKKKISRPAILSELTAVNSNTTSPAWGNLDKSSSQNRSTTYATMTFTSIYDRSN
ncbi:cold-responsive kinase 1-like [Olea europaea subsp. europaea]|uniref:Cold-responsive kinase 1-like n=2 Tax=Olea europaea subsp. europaea TaxID=158383 RepID=A0A8S0TMU0_OLEEU|nr:cold-responsive kinase 1-like [Olea europaea subsp. europaea]